MNEDAATVTAALSTTWHKMNRIITVTALAKFIQCMHSTLEMHESEFAYTVEEVSSVDAMHLLHSAHTAQLTASNMPFTPFALHFAYYVTMLP